MIFSLGVSHISYYNFTYTFYIPIKLISSSIFLNILERTFFLTSYLSYNTYIWGFFLIFGIPDEPPCYVRQCSLVLYIVLNFVKCLGFYMHFISLYGALSLHNCSISGSLVFAHLGSINKIVH